MKKEFYDFEQVYVEERVKNHPNTLRILAKLKNPGCLPPVRYVPDLNCLVKELPVIYHPEKRSARLFLGSIKGQILKKCPGSHGHLCCNYHVINLYIGCPLDCAYCILQAYLNQPFTVINVDIEHIFAELEEVARAQPAKVYRIGTGELGDSLVYDYLTGFSRDFIDFFSHYPNFIFEFKTKTDCIDNLLAVRPPGNIVVGFSLNPPVLIAREEKRAPALEQRLIAASRLAAHGYKVAFHFDPIVALANFEKEYETLIASLFARVKPADVAWISLGTFRYTPDLKQMMEYNYTNTSLLDAEFVECADRKFRYFKPLRTRLYRKLVSLLRSYEPDLAIYLCMESPQVWQKVIGHLPPDEAKTDALFSRAVVL